MRSPAALALFCVVVTVAPSSAQAPGPHAIPKRTLFTARAVSGEVFPRVDVDSDASATGAFIISADAKTVAYRLTWDRLRSLKIDAIDLHNFGRGAVGPPVQTLCSQATKPCPQTRGGTIEGSWSIPLPLTREFGVERIYVDVHTTDAKDGEIRGQLLPLPWMVHSEQFVARLQRNARDVPGNGTATLSITPFPQETQLQLDVTVAGLPDTETTVEIRRGGTGARVFTWRGNDESVKRRGGTISGIVRGPAPELLSVIRAGNATLVVLSKNAILSRGTFVPVK